MLTQGRMVEIMKPLSKGFQVGMVAKVEEVRMRGGFVLEHPTREDVPEGCNRREEFGIIFQSYVKMVDKDGGEKEIVYGELAHFSVGTPDLKALGSGTSGFDEKVKDYNSGLLEIFENKHRGTSYWVQLICGEFTSLCPKTGQPDWAELTVSYVPDVLLVESKALKLYLGSFRNHGDFHEDVCNVIANDLFNLMNPFYLEVYGRFNPRGGIAIYPYVTRCRADDPEWVKFTEQRNLQFAPMPQKGPVLR